MYSLDNIKVELINANDVKNFIYNHGIFSCTCYMTPEKYAERVGLSCLKEGHTSGSRADMFKFRIMAPRFTCDQIMRHSIGTAINCQSQRYVDMDDNFSIYIPPQVMNDKTLIEYYQAFENDCKKRYEQIRLLMTAKQITGEQANDLMRTMLPIGVQCNLTMGFTIEALIHFMNKRLCVRADAPIRKVAQLMRDAVLEIEPRYEELFVSQCKANGFCPEKHGCKAYPSKQEMFDLIEIGKQYRKDNKE